MNVRLQKHRFDLKSPQRFSILPLMSVEDCFEGGNGNEEKGQWLFESEETEHEEPNSECVEYEC